jgi:hypothetical protein
MLKNMCNITFNHPVQLTMNAKKFYDNFDTNFFKTYDYLKNNNLISKNFEFSLEELFLNNKQIEEFIEILSQDWVWCEKGCYITKTGKVLCKTLEYKSIRTLDKYEPYFNIDLVDYSLPRLVYSTFNTIGKKYEDIEVIGFKDGNPNNSNFENIIENEITQIEIDFDLKQFDEINLPHKLYVVLFISKENNTYSKIGITKYNVTQRFSREEGIKIIKYKEFDFDNAILARGYESFILAKVIPYNFKISPNKEELNGGNSECFKPQYYQTIINKITKLLESK